MLETHNSESLGQEDLTLYYTVKIANISFPNRLKQLVMCAFTQVAIYHCNCHLPNMVYEINTCALMKLFVVMF